MEKEKSQNITKELFNRQQAGIDPAVPSRHDLHVFILLQELEYLIHKPRTFCAHWRLYIVIFESNPYREGVELWLVRNPAVSGVQKWSRSAASTCPVYPRSVAIQFSLHLLLAAKFHEGPPVFYPLSLFSKFTKEREIKILYHPYVNHRWKHKRGSHSPRQDTQH